LKAEIGDAAAAPGVLGAVAADSEGRRLAGAHSV